MRKVQSLDAFYVKHQRLLLLVKGHTEIDYLEVIIRMCRLKPFEFFLNKERAKVKLHKHWIDEFGNSVFLKKSNQYRSTERFKILLDDLAIDRSYIINTDLYGGLSIYKTYLMSQSAFILIGKDKETNQNYYMLALFGIDNYLRLFIFRNEEWIRYSPAYLGYEVLREFTGEPIKLFYELKQKMMTTSCAVIQKWLTSVPIPEELKQQLPDEILQQLKGE